LEVPRIGKSERLSSKKREREIRVFEFELPSPKLRSWCEREERKDGEREKKMDVLIERSEVYRQKRLTRRSILVFFDQFLLFSKRRYFLIFIFKNGRRKTKK